MPQPPAFPDIVAEIGSLFGLSRPAGQCFAAIWRAAQPPCADDLTGLLGLSRSNVSTALKELRDWGLITRARAPGDRKDYFTAPPDPWDAVRAVLSARQRRSVAPILDRLIAAEAETGDVRTAALHAVLSTISARMDALAVLDADALARAFAPGSEEKPETAKKKKKKRKS
ncbi:GbsR/MarR family transcriptional regulator [Defluviimonas sp. SAOS-178_SWC]|uniref:GbsR/MarR family transcriptional regulator n=1 Tax=Defluviimonas sp. SAOS-178_SWC TaxID=3121287 RepID=UPI003221BC2E